MNASGRKLRSGKVINKVAGSGKSAMKADPKTENKKVTTKAVTKAVTKTLKSKPAKSDSVKKNKVNEKEENESMLKTKRKSSIKNRTTKRVVLSSKRKANISEAEKSKGFRQMSLKESFLNQEALSKRLRPRKDCRNYCEDSVVRRTSIPSQQENDPTESNKLKLPVYKSIKLSNDTLRNVSDIYDFKFDENDSKEKLIGKRKKRIIKRAVQKKTKKTKCVVQNKLKKARVTLENISNDPITLMKMNKIEVNTDKKHASPSINIVKESDDDVNKQNELMPSIDTNNLEAESNNVQHSEVNEVPLMQDVSEDNKKTAHTKSFGSRIISVENINNTEVLINTTPLRSQQKTFAPFRKTNIFGKTAKSYSESTIHNSLISKSLSPIKKLTTDFDTGSPWRLSPVNTFSQMKSLFQSTPQPKMLQILESKIKRSTKDQGIKCLESTKKNKVSETINEDVNMQKMFEKSNLSNRKVGQVMRKFGREITNLDNSVVVNNENIVNEQYEEVESNKELRLSNKDLQNTIGITFIDTPVLNDTKEDKENAVPKSPSKSPSKSLSKSKKFLKKRLRKTTDINFSPKRKKICIESKENSNMQLQLESTIKLNRSDSTLHSSDKNQEESKEFFEPQPGPSGLQSFKSPSHKPLQQTNLNGFLNVMEIPESTRISTIHGIFDDAQSTPIYGKPFKPIKATNAKRMELDNAFGFNDVSDTILDISPIHPENENVEDKKILKMNVEDKKVLKTNTNVEEIKRPSALPIRILPREIKKNIVSEKVDADENDKKNKKEIEKENAIAEKSLSETKNKVIDVISFSDTFDMLEEAKEVQDDKSLDIPLFTDLPTHFTEPPRRSYKRKRNVRFNFHEDESEEEEDNDNDNKKINRKKKKYGKLKGPEVKRMEEWVQSINETFQEIDHYELVVE